MIRVIIAEDHQALIDGIESFFEYNDDIKIIASANNGKELIPLVKNLNPDVVITDIRMPCMDGIEATSIITSSNLKTNVLAFTMFDQPEAVNKMLKAGAKGYILKNSGLKIMIEAIKAVAEGNEYFDPNVLVNLKKQKKETINQRRGILSKREKEILSHIAEGKKTIEIAKALKITTHTVNSHRKNINRKLGLEPHADLMKIAVEKKYDF